MGKKQYRVWAAVVGPKYLGKFMADSELDAVDKALEQNGSVSLCHQCSSECEDAEIDIDRCTAERVVPEKTRTIPGRE